ncbi:class B sortase [Cohnella sp. GCM10027633]|uniref:class B sortase n=1 Tax=unclassified Cohnella TaxID=2636738 RepID=UPI0036391CBB
MKISKAQWTRWGLLGIAAGVFLFSSYKVYAYVSDNYESKQTYDDVRDLYYDQGGTPIEGPESGAAGTGSGSASESSSDVWGLAVSAKFEPLLEMNDEVVGWLRIADTQVDYPVVQTDDNEYYLTRDVKKEENITGSIFMDYRNNIKGYNRNTILYSHSMKNGTMFGAVLRYESRWNFENKPIIEFDTLYDDEEWVIFSAYKTDTSFDYIRTEFDSDEDYQAYLDGVKAMSLHESDVEVTAQDRILTLSTCYHGIKDGRFVVHAKLVRKNEHALAFDPATGLWRPAMLGQSVGTEETLTYVSPEEQAAALEAAELEAAERKEAERKAAEEKKKAAKKPVKKPVDKPAAKPAAKPAGEKAEKTEEVPAEQPAESPESEATASTQTIEEPQNIPDEVVHETLTETKAAEPTESITSESR